MAVAVIMIGFLVGLTLAQPSIDRAIKDISEAQTSGSDQIVMIKNTDIAIGSVYFNNTTSVLNVTIENVGANVIGMMDVDILLNGSLMDTTAYDGELLYPGTIEEVTIRNVADPRSLRIVGPYGIADSSTSISAG
ncbi:MAG: hypothetical protein U9R75_08465 [Candidatus Thermoplasmatota archaeon]|nr:hypothetical protein [Candidatus Thermoplasmatota archaeon]